MFATFKYYWNGEKNWEKNRTLLALTLENSVLKRDKKNEHYFLGETQKSLPFFCGMMTCRDEFF